MQHNYYYYFITVQKPPYGAYIVQQRSHKFVNIKFICCLNKLMHTYSTTLLDSPFHNL